MAGIPRVGRAHKAALTICCAAMLGCAHAVAELPPAEVSTEGAAFRYYDVHAGWDLVGSITRASPIREEGKIFHAYTRWLVEWRVGWQQGIVFDQCRITSVRVDVSGTITLPRLVEAEPAQERRFQPYITALRQHELGHYRNGRAAAAAVEQRLRSLEPGEDCDALVRAANDAARAIVEQYRERDREYDRVTEHGRTQGASLET